MDLETIAAGLIAYGVSVGASIILVFATYRINTLITNKIDEEQYLLSGNKSVAISLGTIILCQAILLRHAVFPTMAVLRDFFVKQVDRAATFWILIHCFLFFLIIGILSFSSVAIAAYMFSRMTRALPEKEEIVKDNAAVAIFFSFVLIAITLIINEGLEDLSRSIIPYQNSGVIQID